MALKEKALKRLAEKLNAANIVWALTGDYMLVSRGLSDTYHTFDLWVNAADADTADKVLTRLGMRHEEDAGVCARKASYHFDGADINLICGPAYPCGDQVLHMQLTAEDTLDTVMVLGVSVPMLNTENALTASVLGGDKKTAALLKNAVRLPERCITATQETLPEDIVAEIRQLTEEN